ncbi:MAG: single-stranded DNA-binding protein [Planctomycetota bacterium]|nr:MAG: single-stranded DNA-binding protein [Planctomycetota bacterium]
MANLNKVLLIGRLTRDPELRYTNSGTAVADLGLAVNRYYTSPDGTKKDETCFLDITVWGKQAENCHKYLAKGRQVFVEGRLKMDTWEKDGQRRSKIGVVADTVQFLDRSPSVETSYNSSVDSDSAEDDDIPF